MPWRPCLKNWFDVGCSKKCYRYLYFYRSALPQNSQRQLNLPTSPFQTEIVQMTPILQRPSFPEVFNCLIESLTFKNHWFACVSRTQIHLSNAEVKRNASVAARRVPWSAARRKYLTWRGPSMEWSPSVAQLKKTLTNHPPQPQTKQPWEPSWSKWCYESLNPLLGNREEFLKEAGKTSDFEIVAWRTNIFDFDMPRDLHNDPHLRYLMCLFIKQFSRCIADWIAIIDYQMQHNSVVNPYGK